MQLNVVCGNVVITLLKKRKIGVEGMVPIMWVRMAEKGSSSHTFPSLENC